MFVACHARAGLLHSPGSFRSARYRWFIPPNLSCTVAGGCLPSTQREWGAISLHDHIDNQLRSLSAHISLKRQLPVQQHLDSCWGLTSWHPGGVVFVTPGAKSRALTIPTDAIASISYSFSIHHPTSPVMYAVVIWLEMLELNARCCFYWAFMKSCLTRLSDVIHLHAGNEENIICHCYIYL